MEVPPRPGGPLRLRFTTPSFAILVPRTKLKALRMEAHTDFRRASARGLLAVSSPAPTKNGLNLLEANDEIWAIVEVSTQVGRPRRWHLATPVRSLSDETYRIVGFDPTKPLTLDGDLAHAHPEDRTETAALLQKMAAEGCGCDHKYRIVRPGGELRFVRSWAELSAKTES
jgi:hypothetical protein